MDMREYEEFSLILESIRRGIDKLIDKAKKEPYTMFFWSALSPDTVSDDGSFLVFQPAARVKSEPEKYLLSNIGPEKAVFYATYSKINDIFYIGSCTYDHD